MFSYLKHIDDDDKGIKNLQNQIYWVKICCVVSLVVTKVLLFVCIFTVSHALRKIDRMEKKKTLTGGKKKK